MSKFISNSFSINILPLLELGIVRVKKISPDVIPKDVESAIGHEDTARVVSDVLSVAQYTGPRLLEGATMLPEGANIEFFEVSFREEGCRGCRGYDTGSCQTCKLSFWLSGTPLEDC